MQPEDEDSDGDTGRHSSSSKARTHFTSLTPATEKAAMQSLKTKMTFSDNSVSYRHVKLRRIDLYWDVYIYTHYALVNSFPFTMSYHMIYL